MNLSDLLGAVEAVLQPGVSDDLVQSTLWSLEKALRRYSISPKQKAEALRAIQRLKARLAAGGADQAASP